MRLVEHLISFRDKFNKLNITEAGMLDSINHMTLKLLHLIFCVKTSIFWHLLCNVETDVIT